MRTKLSKYESEVHEATSLLHSLIVTENYKHGYAEKLLKLSNSHTFSSKDLNAVIYGIAWTHGIDITRIDVKYIIGAINEPELG